MRRRGATHCRQDRRRAIRPRVTNRERIGLDALDSSSEQDEWHWEPQGCRAIARSQGPRLEQRVGFFGWERGNFAVMFEREI